jgi:hypothetical protein
MNKFVSTNIITKEVIINDTKVNKNKMANKKKSSTGPTSFSLSFKIKSFENEFKDFI